VTGKDDRRLSSATADEEANKDLLWGAAAIADFINELSVTPMSRSKIYHLIENGNLPAGRLGARLVGSKKRIREHLERITGG
jgi:predicted DNA-binding transcriptional regulator AlpA